jgi:hypothetical protein
VTSAEEHHIEYTEGNDHAELLVQTDGVTITVEGDPEEVQRQFEQHYAEALNTTPEELAAVDEYPMPDLDELESIPAEEFYDE